VPDRNHPRLGLTVDGTVCEVDDDGASLLEVLRDRLGFRSVKDGCSPQGQCGCCTVLVDGQPRVACVTPARRVAGRTITTVDGLADRDDWADAFCATGASQCGFCSPGIVVRLSALRARGAAPDAIADVEQALLAHLCRCTGWVPIVDAWRAVGTAGSTTRDLEAAAARAALEGHVAQEVGTPVTLGRGGFADDDAPDGALVAVPDGDGWAVGETLAEARRAAGKVQGRRTTAEARPPLAVPDGEWAATLRTGWVEPAYLETDASWCAPGGEPSLVLGNGGAFGGKVASIAPAAARALADEHGRPVRVLLSREDTVRLGPKRPPVAGGVRRDGTGVLRVARTDGIAAAVAAYAPNLRVEEVDVAGPPTSAALRAAGWAEAAMLLAAVTGSPDVTAPRGGTAAATVADDGSVHVVVRAGDPLDEAVLRSYCTGAAHMAIGFVTAESIAVDDAGVSHDLTVRSFGVLRAVDTPRITNELDPADGPAVADADAVFAAVAAAVWRHQGHPEVLPTGRMLRERGHRRTDQEHS
jgi:aerobic-type carbon monoxide dehydrogenase small subunit (CoxS/CutS family)